MGHIYSRASMVYAWLGPDPYVALYLDCQRSAVETVREYCETRTNRAGWLLNQPLWQNRHAIHQSMLSEGHELPDIYSKKAVRRGLLNFIQLEYWRRAWVTQELVLAADVKLLADQSELPIDGLIIWVDGIQSTIEIALGKWRESVSEPGRWDELRESLANITPFSPSQSALLKGKGLFSLLARLDKKSCCIPRDRIFSLLALCNEGDCLDVDYTSSNEQLLVNVLVTCKDSLCWCSVFVASHALGLTSTSIRNKLGDAPLARLCVYEHSPKHSRELSLVRTTPTRESHGMY